MDLFEEVAASGGKPVDKSTNEDISDHDQEVDQDCPDHDDHCYSRPSGPNQTAMAQINGGQNLEVSMSSLEDGVLRMKFRERVKKTGRPRKIRGKKVFNRKPHDITRKESGEKRLSEVFEVETSNSSASTDNSDPRQSGVMVTPKNPKKLKLKFCKRPKYCIKELDINLKNKALYDKLLDTTETDHEITAAEEIVEEIPREAPFPNLVDDAIFDEFMRDADSHRELVEECKNLKIELQKIKEEEIRRMTKSKLAYLKAIESGNVASSRHVLFDSLRTRRILTFHAIHDPFTESQVDWVFDELSLVKSNHSVSVLLNFFFHKVWLTDKWDKIQNQEYILKVTCL